MKSRNKKALKEKRGIVTCYNCLAIIAIKTRKKSKKLKCIKCLSKNTVNMNFTTENTEMVSNNKISFSAENEMNKSTKDYQENERKISIKEQLIPLGSLITIKDHKWEVLGYLEVAEMFDGKEDVWCEYLLENKSLGYRWLTEFDGHWNFISPCEKKNIEFKPNTKKYSSKNIPVYLERQYQLFHLGKGVIKFKNGNFFWPVKIGDTFEFEDYIAPPYVLTCEKNAGEENWLQGEYLHKNEVKKILTSEKIPYRFGVYLNQVNKYIDIRKNLIKPWILFLIVLISFQLWIIYSSKNELIFEESFVHVPSSNEKSQISKKFELTDSNKNLELKLIAYVNDNFFDMSGKIVNEENGEIYNFFKSIYYSSEDGSGSQIETVSFSSIPNGKYQFILEGVTDAKVDTPCKVIVLRDVTIWSNFILSIIFLSIIPIFFLILEKRYEKKRWENSNFSP
ncbi:DUF4178 domain-containing protein [Pigmentibacter ruber]|uniref:DUF4178 domain-containing protein n=1 Tax=Pigmentibacter ruber TaxID=2683196 RepID=UPI00131B95A0|nr:DUF4178 domain-containing protein [Pigmentibacter ruber]